MMPLEHCLVIGSLPVRSARTLGAATLAVLVVGCASGEPVLVSPKTPLVSLNACPSASSSFSLDRAEDKRGYADVHEAGFTQTGTYKTKTMVRTDRPAALYVKYVLRAALERCGMLDDSGRATALTVHVLTFKVEQANSVAAETITGDVRYEVIAQDPSTGQVIGRFTANGTSDHSGFDAWEWAQETLEEAMAASLPRFVGRVSKLSR
jgi:hypothetical protein